MAFVPVKIQKFIRFLQVSSYPLESSYHIYLVSGWVKSWRKSEQESIIQALRDRQEVSAHVHWPERRDMLTFYSKEHRTCSQTSYSGKNNKTDCVLLESGPFLKRCLIHNHFFSILLLSSFPPTTQCCHPYPRSRTLLVCI